MSCKGTVNINTSKNYNKCSLLCDYEFKFNTTKSSCSITNKKKSQAEIISTVFDSSTL